MKTILIIFLLLIAPAIQAQENPAACNIANENWCGSGNLCGYDTVDGVAGAWVDTNAHVATTRIGDRMVCKFKIRGQTVTKYGYNKFAAYSERFAIDWALVFVPGLTSESGIVPVKLSKELPTGREFITTGSPRCAWPLVYVSDYLLVDTIQSGRVYRWRRASGGSPAIGGQSGSAVQNKTTGHEEIKLTWIWGGLGAGQPTALMWKQKQNKTASKFAPLRTPDLIIPGPDGNPVDPKDRQVEDGFFEDAPLVGAMLAAGIQELPIWVGDDAPPIAGLTAPEIAACLKLKKLGFDLMAISDHYQGLVVKESTDLSGPISGVIPDPVPDPIIVNRPAAWTPPPGDFAPVVGTVHDGRRLTLVEICENGICRVELQWISVQ